MSSPFAAGYAPPASKAGAVSEAWGQRKYLVPELVDRWPAIPELGLAAGEAFSVTTYTGGGIPKPWLAPWAAKVEREYIANIAAVWGLDLRASVSVLRVTQQEAIDAILYRVGKPYAFEVQRDAAADIGTEAHAAIERWTRTELGEILAHCSLGPAADIVYNGFLEWARDVDFKPIACEQRVHLVNERTVGRFDLCGYVRGKRTMVDAKSSNQTGLDHKLQVVAYACAADDLGIFGDCGDGEPDALILRLPKTEEGLRKLLNRRGANKGKPFEEHLIPFAEHERMMGIFRGAQAIFHEMNQRKMRDAE